MRRTGKKYENWLGWLNRILNYGFWKPIVLGARFNITDPKKEDVMITIIRSLFTNVVIARRFYFVIARSRALCHCEEAEGRRSNPLRLFRLLRSLAMTILLLLFTFHLSPFPVYAQQERVLVAHEQAYSNMIGNASFESWSNGTGTADSVPDAWTKEGAPTTYDKLSADKRLGSLSAQVVVNAASQGIKQTVTVEPNTTYTVGFYYKTGVGSFAFTITGTITPALSGNTALSAASWTYKPFAFTTGAATTSITLNFLSEGLTDVFKLDGIMLSRGSLAPAFVEKAFTDTGDQTAFGDIKVQDIDSTNYILLDKDTGNITATGVISGSGGVISGLTPGKIPKANTAATLTDSVITESSGNVGIGTTGPGAKLHIYDGSSRNIRFLGGSSGHAAEFIDGTGYTTSVANIFIQDADNNNARASLHIKGNDGAIESLWVSSTGNVGIGTTGPIFKLHVDGDNIGAIASVGTTRADLFAVDSGAGADLKRLVIRSDGGNLSFVGENDAINTARTSMTIVAGYGGTGNVGIGTTVPSQKLDIAGSINLSNYLKIGGNTVVNVDGTNNLLLGVGAGASLTTGQWNVFVGKNAGNLSTEATANVFIGKDAGEANTTGVGNVFVGADAGDANTSGINNVTMGEDAGGSNTTGSNNTYLGFLASEPYTNASYNVSVGSFAGQGFVGNYPNYSSTISIGYSSYPTANNQAVIGGNQSGGAIYDFYLGEGVQKVSPAGVTIQATGGAGSNNTGASLTVAGGKGTGNATGGNIIFKTSDAGASGATLQSLSEKVRITNLGNVGIGTTGPTEKLLVSGGSIGVVNGAGNDVYYWIGELLTAGNYGYTKWDGTNDKLQLGTSAGGVGITLQEDGKVGIGTTGPGAKLEVAGGGIAIPANQKFDLEGSAGNTYIEFDTANNWARLYVNGVGVAKFKQK
ncbi:MAG: hypothetical protein L6246_02150 [Thermodesulfovibrionales bacterium]|nr:hypothetical protein [Thermodesulfovibrionales bacterium]